MISALVSDDLQKVVYANNRIQEGLNTSIIKYVSTHYSYIYQHNDKKLYAIIISEEKQKYKVVMDTLTEEEKKLLQDINLEEWNYTQ